MRVMSEVVKTRSIYNRVFEMQVAKIKSGEAAGKYQATYYWGADPVIWGECYLTPEIAIRSCDEQFNFTFNLDNDEEQQKTGKVQAPIDEE